MEVMLHWLHDPNWAGDLLLVEGTRIIYGYILTLECQEISSFARKYWKRGGLV